MRAAATSLLKQSHECFTQQLCRYAQVAIAHPSSYVDIMPEALPWKSALSQLQQTQVSTLDNGMRVATQLVPHSDISTVGVYIDAGSRYETEENNGVAHFLEHLMFKGTKSRSIQDIETQVENMGASINAYTSRESTAFYARCIGRDVSKSMDILGDMVMNSKLDSASIARERDVILREAKEIDGMVEEVVLDHLHATAFQHTPLGRTILGSAQNIRSMTKEDVEAYIRAHYTAGRMVVVASGNVDHGEVVSTANKLFSGLPADSSTAASLVAAEPSYFTGSSVSVREPDMTTSGLAVAFKGASHLDPDSVTLSVMANMLGAWSKDKGTEFHQRSRLATAIAQNGLADSVMGFNTPYHDTGLFGVYTQTSSPDKFEDLSWCIMQEVTRLCYEVDEADVALARTQTKANHLALLSHSNGLCEDIAKQLLMYGRIMPREEYFARIDAVTTDVVRDCAARRIQDQDMAVSAVGELSFLPHYNWFRRRSYWNRY